MTSVSTGPTPDRPETHAHQDFCVAVKRTLCLQPIRQFFRGLPRTVVEPDPKPATRPCLGLIASQSFSTAHAYGASATFFSCGSPRWPPLQGLGPWGCSLHRYALPVLRGPSQLFSSSASTGHRHMCAAYAASAPCIVTMQASVGLTT